MSLIIKDSDTLATSETSSRPGSAAPGDPPTRPQPVALEVPVAVNGARTVEGGDKREPFSEATKTLNIRRNFSVGVVAPATPTEKFRRMLDRKSTRLNSSHVAISYAVFCLKKKKKTLELYS